VIDASVWSAYKSFSKEVRELFERFWIGSDFEGSQHHCVRAIGISYKLIGRALQVLSRHLLLERGQSKLEAQGKIHQD